MHQEIISINGVQYMHTWCNEHCIRQIETGYVYADAIDTVPCLYTYEETDEPLPKEPELLN